MTEHHIPGNSLERADLIFIEALEIECADERQNFLERACKGDGNLRSEVDRLFALQTESEPYFDAARSISSRAAGIANSLTELPEFSSYRRSSLPDDGEVGKRIGSYRLLQRIGEGGVGIVYLAQECGPVRRKVALKIIKAGMDTKNVIARFEAERQALAMMEHPNIAHVLNAGETETGRPYFVMELVQGERITTYCDENKLSIRERLELFIQVCHAIQHAHQKGIIHRDIKPSNVLITQHDGVPRPVVIDFGIAKATGGELLTDKTVNTPQSPFIGTPAYMSPEQTNLTEIDIDTRSDIYSLGVLLYELLVSATPFNQKELLKSGVDELCRILREREPPPPSARLRQLGAKDQEATADKRDIHLQRLRILLTGDLDWIVMKALEKDRARRYETANALAVDIERFLNHEPVLARSPSRLYQFQKLVRRNKATFAYLAAICLSVFAGLGASTWLFIREREARSTAEELRAEADARAKIAQAALLLSRNNQAEADRLVDRLQIPVTEPSLEAASVFRDLAVWNIEQGRWERAADCYLNLQQANQLDKSNTTEEMTRDLLGAGPALIVSEEPGRYRRLVAETLLRFATTSDPTAAERVIKNSLILPPDQSTLLQLQPLVSVVRNSFASDEAKSNDQLSWRSLSLSLHAYRCGDYPEAVFWGERSLAYSDRSPPRLAMVHLLLAMAHARLHESGQVQGELAAAREPILKRLPNGTERIADLGSPDTGVWHDWVIAYLLLQEAEAEITNDIH